MPDRDGGRAELRCEELVALIGGALSPAMRDRVVAHLARCSGCRDYVDQIRATIGALSDLPDEEPDEQLLAELLDAFRDVRREREG